MDEKLELRPQLETFFRKHIPKDSKVLQVMKVINQSMLAPPYIALKSIFAGVDLPVTDMGGFYSIKVVFKQSEVVVVHSKKVKAVSECEDDYFEFLWHLQIILDSKLDKFKDIEIILAETSMGDKMKDSKKKRLSKLRQHELFG
jgi:hypothetical protein